jgi:hypothetical protein
MGGLLVVFRASPAPPAVIGGEFACELEDVRLDLEDLRIVGDAAPGDDRTRVDRLELEWPTNDPEDLEVWFEDAPPGNYSNAFATLTRYDFDGSVTIDGDNVEFELARESTAITLSIPLGGVVLEPGTIATIVIEVSVAPLLIEFPWDEADDDGGEIQPEDDDPILEPVSDALATAFHGSVGP